MDDQRTQTWSERRSRFEPFRCRRGDTPAAAGANTTMAIDAGDGRADRRQVDVVVGVGVGLIGSIERVSAVRAGGQRRIDGAIGVLGQRTGNAGAA
jgi:hypothetical protein